MTSPDKPTQTLNITLDGGMDQRRNARYVEAPTMLAAQNVRYSSIGGVTKRFGMTTIASTFNQKTLGSYSPIAGKGRVMALRDEAIFTDGYRCGTFSPSDGQTRVFDRGKVPEAVSRAKNVPNASGSGYGVDVAYCRGYVFHCFLRNNVPTPNSTLLFMTTEDVNTGALIDSHTLIDGGDFSCGHLVANATDVVLIYKNRDPDGTTPKSIFMSRFDFTTMSWPAPTALITNGALAELDACTDGSFLYLLYKKSSNNKLSIRKYFLPTMAFITSVDCSEAGAMDLGNVVGIHATLADRVWIAYTKTGETVVRCAAHDTALVETTPPFTVHTNTVGGTIRSCVPLRLSTTTAMVSISGAANLPYQVYSTFPVINTSGGFVGLSTSINKTIWWVEAISRPFVSSMTPLRVHVWVLSGGAATNVDTSVLAPNTTLLPLQYTATMIDTLCDDTTTNQLFWARPIAWHTPRFASADGVMAPNGVIAALAHRTPCSVVQGALPTTWYSDFTSLPSSNGPTNINTAITSFDSPDKFITCELGRGLVATPGHRWDRGSFTELGFNYFPQRIDVSAANTGGNITAGTVGTFRVTYEWLDGNGLSEISQPSNAYTATIPAGGTGINGSFAITVPALTVSWKDEIGALIIRLVRISVYVLNTTTQVYERLQPTQVEQRNAPYLKSVTITVTTLQTSVPGGAFTPDILYTESGVLPNVSPPSFTACTTYRNRVWFAFGNVLGYSKSFTTGEAISFSDAFQLPLEESGDITSLWTQDDTLYVSTKDRIYFLQANGPNDFGTGSDLSTPNRVATDRGVVDQRSIAVTPIGTLYQSSVGIQLLDRSRSVAPEPIGARVQTELANYPVISSALVHPTGRYVSFVATSADNSASKRLIYDYTQDKWSFDIVSTISGSGIGYPIYNEAVAGSGVYAILQQGGFFRMLLESKTKYLDFIGDWVDMRIDLGEVHPAGPQSEVGYEKWIFMAQKQTDHNLNFEWRSDYASAPFDTRALNFSVITAGQEQYDISPSTHIAQSMRLSIYDAVPFGPGGVIGTGQGAVFIGLAVNIDTLGTRTFRAPATQQR